jgi:cytoskeletal protein RodZ
MVEKLTPTEARQGRKGTNVLVVLIVALILAAVVWWGVGIYGSAIEPENPVGGAPAEQGLETTQPPATDQPSGPAAPQ